MEFDVEIFVGLLVWEIGIGFRHTIAQTALNSGGHCARYALRDDRGKRDETREHQNRSAIQIDPINTPRI